MKTANKVARDLVGGRLGRTATRTELVTRVQCHDDRLDVTTVSWAGYWDAVPLAAQEPLRRLFALWETAITSAATGHADLREAYESLLTAATGAADPAFLRRAVGFESFEIRGDTPDERCAGVFTGRHPILARNGVIRPSFRDVHNDLPVVAPDGGETFELYSYYRQHRLPAPAPMSLALYLPASGADRRGAYRLLRRLAPLISDGRDPFAGERARRIARQIIEPVLRCLELGVASATAIEFVDVGMGQGNLVAAVATELARARSQLRLSPLEVSVWGTDLRPGSLRGRRFLTNTDIQADDYRRWIWETLPCIPERRTGVPRIALVSKVLDALTSAIVRPGRPLDGIRTNALLSTAPARRTSYLCAAASATGCHVPHGPEMDCAAVREPDMSSMEFEGASIIGQLTDHCDLVVIEDPDIGPAELRDHRRRFGLPNVVAFDLSGRWSLRSHCMVVARNDRLRSNPGGSRIW